MLIYYTLEISLFIWVLLVALPFITDRFNPEFKNHVKDLTVNIVPSILSIVRKNGKNDNLLIKTILYSISVFAIIIVFTLSPIILLIYLIQILKRKRMKREVNGIKEESGKTDIRETDTVTNTPLNNFYNNIYNRVKVQYVEFWTTLPITPNKLQVLFIDNQEESQLLTYLKTNEDNIHKLFTNAGLYFHHLSIPQKIYPDNYDNGFPIIYLADKRKAFMLKGEDNGSTIYIKDEIFNDENIKLSIRDIFLKYACQKTPTPSLIKYIKQTELEDNGVNRTTYLFSCYSLDSYISDEHIWAQLNDYIRYLGLGFKIPKQKRFRIINKDNPYLFDGMSRIFITQDYKILLTDFNNIEIEMSPLPKTVYLLFLKYSDGILFKHLYQYKDELENIYKAVSNREAIENMEKSIADLTDPTKNSLNEKCSRIREALLKVFNQDIAVNYYITGERGEIKKIELDRRFVKWESNL